MQEHAESGRCPNPAQIPAIRLLCHDLRQPLVVAVGYVSMIEEGSFGDLSDELGEVIHTIAGRLDAMNRLIEGILTQTLDPPDPDASSGAG